MRNFTTERPSARIIIISILLLDVAIGLLVPPVYQAVLLFGTAGFFSAIALVTSFRSKSKRSGLILVAGIIGLAGAIYLNEWYYQSLFFNQKDDLIRFGALFGTFIGALIGIRMIQR